MSDYDGYIYMYCMFWIAGIAAVVVGAGTVAFFIGRCVGG